MQTIVGRVQDQSRIDRLQAADRLNSDEVTLTSLWHVLLRRRFVCLAVIVLSIMAGLLIASRPARYTADGTLQVRPGSANKYKVQVSEIMGGGDSDDRIDSEITILQSRTLYTKVAEQLHLAANKEFAGKLASPNASMQDPHVQAEVIAHLRKAIAVERTPKTQILTIRCTSTSPLVASEIVNTLVNLYIEHIFETGYGSTQRAAKFLTRQLDDLKDQVLQDQKQLVDLQSKLGVVGFDDNHNLITSQLEDLARASGTANVQRIIAEAKYRILQDERPDLIDGGASSISASGLSSSSSSLIQSLRATRAELATQYASVSEQFGPNYPQTKRLKAQLAEAERQTANEEERILEQAKVSYEAAQRNQSLTSAALAASQKAAFQKRNDMVNYQILLHDYQANRTLYEGLLQRLREAGVVSGLESGEVELVDLATLPVTPVGPGRMQLMLIALAIGCCVAIVFAVISEALDTSVHNVDELERYVGLPVLSVLPSFDSLAKRGARKALPGAGLEQTSFYEVVRAPQSPFSEGIRLLRSSVLLARAGHRPKHLLFTSALPGEGKSTVCGNEACLLAQNEARVLLIDADLRRPSQHRKFGLANSAGLSTVLTGRSSLDEAAQYYPMVPGLSILTSGPLPPSPGELLASSSMTALLEEAAGKYDFVLLDAPPSLTISDASILADQVDVVVLVVRDGLANKKAVLRTVKMLLRVGANLPGFVFNGVNRRSREYYEYSGQYSQEYSYGVADA